MPQYVAVGTTAAAFVGGTAVALCVTLCAWRGGLDPMRLVLVGIGVNALAAAVVAMLLVQTDLARAADAVTWLTGTLDGRTWRDVGPLWGAIATAGCLITLVAFDFRVTHLGSDIARALGVRVAATSVLLWCAAVVLTAAAVAAAGPIGFVALAAPQLARLLYRVPTPPLVGSAVMGAVVDYFVLVGRNRSTDGPR